MARKRRRFTPEFGRVALEALQERDSVQAIATRHVHPVSAWKRQLLDAEPRAGGGSSQRSMRRRSTTCRRSESSRSIFFGAG